MAFIVCLPIAAAIAYAFDKKIEEGIPVAMFLATFVTYLLGIFGHLSISPIVVIVLAVLSLGYSVYGVFKEHSVKRYLTFGGVTFLLLGGYYGLVCRGRMIAEQDDLMVYGKYVADFYHVGKVYRYDYIPGMMMWEYLSEKFWTVFSESVLFWAVAMVCVAMFVAIFSEKDKKSWIHYAFAIIFIVLLPIATKNRETYMRLQNDFVMGITMAYITVMYQKARETADTFYEHAAFCGLAFLTLTKVTGMILAVILILMFIGVDVLAESGRISWKRISFVVKCAISIFISKFSWTIYVSQKNRVEKFSDYVPKLFSFIFSRWYLVIALVLAIVVAVFVLKWIVENGKQGIYAVLLLVGAAGVFGLTYAIMPADIRNEAIKNFGNIIFSTYAPDRSFGFGYRFYASYGIVLLLLMFIWMIGLAGAQDKNAYKASKSIMVFLNIGFAVFSAFLFLATFLTRNSSQTARAKECERYMYTYIVFYIVVCIYQFTKFDVISEKIYRIVLGFLTVAMLLTANTGGVVSQIFEKDDYYNFDGLNYLSIRVNERFYFVDQKGELNYSRFNFRVSPGVMQNNYFSDMIVDELFLGEGEPERYLTEYEWSELLKKCKYVYVAATNDDFADMYGNLFEDEIVDGRIYRVSTEDDKVMLKSIEY